MIKYILQTTLMIYSVITWATETNSHNCHIDAWFNQTTQAENLQLNSENQHIERENIWLSQFPALIVSASSSTANSETFDKIFRVKSISPVAGLSLNLYSGGKTSLDLKDNDADQKLNTLDKKSARNSYLVNLLNNLYTLKNIQNTLRDIEQQIDYLNKIKLAYQFQVKKGERPEIELDIIKSQINNLHVNSETLNNDYQKNIKNIARQFFIPVTVIQNLNYSDISSCVDVSELKINMERLRIAKEKQNIELRKIDARLLPEINLSAGINPINDSDTVKYNRGQYQVSLNASVNLSSLFQINNDKKQVIIRLRQNELSYEDALVTYKNDRDNIIANLKNASLQLQEAQQNMSLETRRLEYVKTQYTNGKETFIAYMDEISRLLMEKNRLSQFENQRDYYEALYYFYN